MAFTSTLLNPLLKWFVRRQAQKNLPDYNQNQHLKGLKGTVEIIRDTWGIPHIYAQNEADLFFAQGYVHAQDRLWQMELLRRVVSGRLSEIIGKETIEIDKITRTFGFRHLAEQDARKMGTTPSEQTITAYTQGVNAYIQQTKTLPAEYKLLRFEPEPWQIADSLAIARFLSLQMSQGWLHEIERLFLATEYGMEKAEELFPEYPLKNPTPLGDKIETNKRTEELLEAFKGPFLRPIQGSNNWVVAPEKMETGAAALCNDPHLIINAPNIWYENHLVTTDGYANTGVSMPGVPMVLIGHNEQIAWGITLSYADVQDTYIEQFVSEGSSQYRFKDRILKADVRQEKIQVKGEKEAVELTCKSTIHGPVLAFLPKDQGLSLCTKALQDNEMLAGFYNMNKAADWDDFVHAVQQMTIPSLNIVYADKAQNIGYYMSGEVPIRERSKGLLPHIGYSGDQEWTGKVPFEEMPHALNPKSGYFYTCNNKIVSDDFPHDLGHTWMNGYRAKRLRELFASKERYNFEDFAAWQLDFMCLPGLTFAKLVAAQEETAAYQALSTEVKSMAELLINWDGYLTADSQGGVVYEVLKQELIKLVFQPAQVLQGLVSQKEVSIFLVSEFFGHDVPTLLRLFENPASKWWKMSPEETLLKALEATKVFLEEQLGATQSGWQWGRLHQFIAKHPLATQDLLKGIFDIGPFPIGGDTDTLCQIANIPEQERGNSSMIGPSFRQLLDLGDWDNCLCCAPLGQSGNTVSPHYKDQLDNWVQGKYKPMLWSKEKVLAAKTYSCTLEPEQ
ncbi:MAG: penicillin acylase family protein [Aureispira sp.]